jgi:hypothetical protein
MPFTVMVPPSEIPATNFAIADVRRHGGAKTQCHQ